MPDGAIELVGNEEDETDNHVTLDAVIAESLPDVELEKVLAMSDKICAVTAQVTGTLMSMATNKQLFTSTVTATNTMSLQRNVVPEIIIGG